MATWVLSVDALEESTGSIVRAYGTATVSGTYTTGGDTFSLAHGKLPFSKPPLFLRAVGIAGFVYQFVKGSTLVNGLMKIFCNTAGGSNAALGEHTAASVVAGVTGDTIRWEAAFVRE